jgi:guanylate kinase
MQRSGLFFVLSAPSGTGKTSINTALLAKDPELSTSISATTRKPRNGESHGKSYYFLEDDAFSKAVEMDHFVEYAKVFNHRYGTLKGPLEQASAWGKDVLLALDWQGAQSMRQLYGQKAVLIYILPPRLSDLKERLHERGQDHPDCIAERLACAYGEIQNCVHYDYIVVNENLNKAVDQAWSIIQSERCRCNNQKSLDSMIKKFAIMECSENL